MPVDHPLRRQVKRKDPVAFVIGRAEGVQCGAAFRHELQIQPGLQTNMSITACRLGPATLSVLLTLGAVSASINDSSSPALHQSSHIPHPAQLQLNPASLASAVVVGHGGANTTTTPSSHFDFQVIPAPPSFEAWTSPVVYAF
ncbi:hypothetical protein VP01_107g3 [Puccinia sorghi]|uniref:Uncharacterized protein n=1 Tax=Puccinia sorghi TaxID=27349 RepID=A0A0L6VTE3_9BASI|nr:hypothetical protein VP01_107g3 [Puccinia sorghi]